MRLDKYLNLNKMIQSREKSKEIIRDGFVFVNGKKILKPSFNVNSEDKIEIIKRRLFIGRAGEKLDLFLGFVPLLVKNKTVLDIGSSIGGFVEVLLRHGAKRVYALDVGKNQLHSKFKNDKRVISFEETDIRDFHPSFGFELVTCDVSFISLNKILTDIDRVSKKDIILLFKPQFEVGLNAKRDKKGVVVDKKAVKNAMEKFETEIKKLNWVIMRKEISAKRGKEGNEEFFYHCQKH